VGSPAQERSFVLVDALLLHFLLGQLDLTGQAFHCLDVGESLPSQLVSSSLHLLNAGRKTADSAVLLQGAFCVGKRCPGVGDVQEESVGVDLH
jgi:hypothetical protein